MKNPPIVHLVFTIIAIGVILIPAVNGELDNTISANTSTTLTNGTFGTNATDMNKWYLSSRAAKSLMTSSVIAIPTPGTAWTEAIPTGRKFSQRVGHSAVVHDNKMWVIGGMDADKKPLNDVWYSSDGRNWRQATSSALFSPRAFSDVVSFNNEMWLIGGIDDVTGNHYNDIWHSGDGIFWRKTDANGPFTPRYGHTMVVYNGKMWLIGGYDGSYRNDVWSSRDGFTWTKETESALFPPRHMMTSVVFNNRMWILGGEIDQDPSVPISDVWSSSDGITWVREMFSGDFPARYGHTTLVHDGKMWLIGGVGDSFGDIRYNDVWNSANGKEWTQVTPSTGFSPRYYFDGVVLNDNMWVFGGYDGAAKNDVWFRGKQEYVEKTFSITNSMYDKKKPTLASTNVIGSVMGRLNDARWGESVFSESGPTVTRGYFGGDTQEPASHRLNDATLHYHVGHGSFQDKTTGNSSLVLLKSTETNGNYDGDWFNASDVHEKWGGKNKWVVLQSCNILADKKWGGVLGTTHAIFGFANVENNDPGLPENFLGNALKGDTLYDSWRSATTKVFKDTDMAIYYEDDGSMVKGRKNITAAVYFKTEEQMKSDHLPDAGTGHIAPDDIDPDFIFYAWDCGSNKDVEL